MRSWQDRGMPICGDQYTAVTDHRKWDGKVHYWTGMAVEGMSDHDSTNPNCCPNLDIYEGGEVEVDTDTLKGLRAGLIKSGYTHRVAGEQLGMGLSHLRQRLYGQRPFLRAQYSALCRLAGVDKGEHSTYMGGGN